MFIVDTAAIESDASPESIEKHLANLAREADAFVIVLRCFGDLDHQGAPLDPAGDLEALLLELAMADLSIVEKRLDRLQSGRAPRNPNEEQLLLRLKGHLSEGGLVYQLSLTPEDLKLLGGLTLITSLPLLVVCNIGDDDRSAAGRRCRPPSADGAPPAAPCHPTHSGSSCRRGCPRSASASARG